MYKIRFVNDRDKWIILGVCVVCYLIGLYVGVHTKFIEFTHTDEYKEYQEKYRENWYYDGNYSGNINCFDEEEYVCNIMNRGIEK